MANVEEDATVEGSGASEGAMSDIAISVGWEGPGSNDAVRHASPRVSSDVATDSLADLYASNYASMVRLAHLLTGSADVAPDLVHDAFVRLHSRWIDVRDPAHYLRRSVVNACQSWHRHRFVERDRLPKLAVSGSVEFAGDEMHDAMLALPYRQRAAIVLRYTYALSDDDIGATLGVRPATVRSLLHRGLAGLRGVIDQ